MKFTVSLKENRVFRRLYAKGKSAVAPTMVLYCRRNGRRESRLGLTTGTKLGHAVVRNKVRRRLREIYRLHEDRFAPGYDIVVVARVRAVHSSYAVLERDFLRLAKKLRYQGFTDMYYALMKEAENGRQEQGGGTEAQGKTRATHGGSFGHFMNKRIRRSMDAEISMLPRNKKGLTFYGQTFLVQHRRTGKPG